MKYERKVELIDEVEVVELESCLAVKSEMRSECVSYSFFVSKKDAAGVDVYNLHKIKKKYIYLPDKFWEGIKEDTIDKNVEHEYRIDPLDAIKLPNFNEHNVVYSSVGYDGFIYHLDAVNPISLTYHLDYIGGVTNQDYDLEKAYEILSKNPNVKNIKKIDIPYYNRERNYTRALEFSVLLPQDTHDRLCNFYRDTIKETYWSCRVKESIVYKSWFQDYGWQEDVLELKPAYKGKI